MQRERRVQRSQVISTQRMGTAHSRHLQRTNVTLHLLFLEEKKIIFLKNKLVGVVRHFYHSVEGGSKISVQKFFFRIFR